MVQLRSIKTEDIDLNWTELQKNWADIVDLIVLYFPHTEQTELLKLDGDLTSFARYLADVHDLTFKEAVESIDFILLLDLKVPQRRAVAA